MSKRASNLTQEQIRDSITQCFRPHNPSQPQQALVAIISVLYFSSLPKNGNNGIRQLNGKLPTTDENRLLSVPREGERVYTVVDINGRPEYKTDSQYVSLQILRNLLRLRRKPKYLKTIRTQALTQLAVILNYKPSWCEWFFAFSPKLILAILLFLFAADFFIAYHFSAMSAKTNEALAEQQLTMATAQIASQITHQNPIKDPTYQAAHTEAKNLQGYGMRLHRKMIKGTIGYCLYAFSFTVAGIIYYCENFGSAGQKKRRDKRDIRFLKQQAKTARMTFDLKGPS